jgi:hypothetical protein
MLATFGREHEQRLNHEEHEEHEEEQSASALLRVLRETFVFFV